MNRLSLIFYCVLLVFLLWHQGSFAARSGGQSSAGISNSSVSKKPDDLKNELLELQAARAQSNQNVDSQVRLICRIGELHLELSDLDPALVSAHEALALTARTKDKALRVDALVFAARVDRYRQENRTALKLLADAHRLSVEQKYRAGEASSLTELSATYFLLSDLPQAQSCGERALHIWRELHDKRGEATALTGLGEIFMRVGEAAQAKAALDQAVRLWRELGDPANQATALVDLNFLSIRLGQWQSALSLLNQAQALVQDKEAKPYLGGQIANSFGEVYEAYGKLETALSYYEEATKLYRDYAHDAAAAVDAARQAGRVEARQGNYARAVERITKNLQTAQRLQSVVLVALCHEDLGIVHLEAGSLGKSERELRAAISLYPQIGSRREWARALTFLGQTQFSQGKLAAAADSYHQALRVFATNQDYTDEAAVRFGLGRIALSQQKLDEAGQYLQRSIQLTEQLRENASSKDLRASFLASVHDRYETYVEWLMARHAAQPDRQFDVQAFEASDAGRARSLLDTLKNYQRELRQTADPSLLLDEEKLQAEEQGVLDRKARLISEGAPAEAKAAVENELVQVRSRSEALQAQINDSSRFNNLLRPAPLSFAEMRKQLTDGETALLEYSLGNQQSYLWILTSAGFDSYKLPNKETIEQVARKLGMLLTKPQSDAAVRANLEAARLELSSLILGQVAGKLNARRLIVVSDGILQYLPFQILSLASSPERPLVADYEIINAPSASTLAAVSQAAAGRQSGKSLVAAMGDPVLPADYVLRADASQRGLANKNANPPASVRAGGAEETFEPTRLQHLAFAKQELNQLRAFMHGDGSIIYADFGATRDNLRRLTLGDYRILHFATHGFLDSKQPELSGLVLSLLDAHGRPLDGFVGLSDIYNLRASVDLVVLSACQTALGTNVRGEGLIGLTRGFMYAGASSVVASLWNVDDESTAELMKRFYGNMLERGMTPAAALREAQNSIRAEPQWRSPYYWAAFTLQGDYRQVIKPAPTRFQFSRSLVVGAAVVALLLAISLWWFLRRFVVR